MKTLNLKNFRKICKAEFPDAIIKKEGFVVHRAYIKGHEGFTEYFSTWYHTDSSAVWIGYLGTWVDTNTPEELAKTLRKYHKHILKDVISPKDGK